MFFRYESNLEPVTLLSVQHAYKLCKIYVCINNYVYILRTPLPVIVYFTGGGWLIGTAEFYLGMVLAPDGQVIVVTV